MATPFSARVQTVFYIIQDRPIRMYQPRFQHTVEGAYGTKFNRFNDQRKWTEIAISVRLR